MKKLIGLFIIMLFSSNIFGQALTEYSNIELDPVRTVEGMIQGDKSGNVFTWIDKIVAIHFLKGDILYLLTYEPLPKGMRGCEIPDGFERNVYLYKKDISNVKNPWFITSDIVFTGKWIDWRNNRDIKLTYSKIIEEGENLVVEVEFHNMINSQYGGNVKNGKLIFQPNGDKYSVKTIMK